MSTKHWIGMLFVFVGYFFFLNYQIQQHPQLKNNSFKQLFLHPFDTRVHYRIGNIDPRFGLTHDEVKQLLGKASYLWQRDTGKQWFVYDDKATLTVNFVFNEQRRKMLALQKNKQRIQQIEEKISRDDQRIDTQRRFLESEADALQQEIREFNQQSQQLNAMLQQDIPEYQRQSIHQQLAVLAQKREILSRKRESLAQQEERFNQQITATNQEKERFNTAVNKLTQEVEREDWKLGVFFSQLKKIDIYFYEDKNELLFVLAHELGHALGLKHNEDPQALMYPDSSVAHQTDFAYFHLQPADLAMLHR